MTRHPQQDHHPRPDCVTEIRMGNTVLTVSGYFKQDTTDTAADKMAKCPGGRKPLPDQPRPVTSCR